MFTHRNGININPKINYPHIIEIELTNDCNLQCKHCHRNVMMRPIGYMEYDVFKKIIDEITSYPIAFLRIVGLGESSLHPNFSQMLQYASSKGLKIEIATNGSLFERYTENEILSWDIDILGISVDGIDKETYEKIRVGGDYHNLRQNVEQFYNYKRRIKSAYPLVVIRKVILPSDKGTDIDQYTLNWKKISDLITFNTLSKADNKTDFIYKSSFKCSEFYFTSHIRYDGSVIICPNKFIFDKNDTIGNVKFEELKQIWKSDKLVEIRELHKKKQFPDFCQRCFLSFNKERAFENGRKYNFSKNIIQNKLNKFINVS